RRSKSSSYRSVSPSNEKALRKGGPSYWLDVVVSGDDFDAHRACGALDALDGGVDGCGVQVGHLLSGDLSHLRLGDLADLLLVGRAGALLDARGFLQQDRRGRRFGDEGEAAVGVDGDDDRDDEPGHLLVLRARVELLAELHDVDLGLAEGG